MDESHRATLSVYLPRHVREALEREMGESAQGSAGEKGPRSFRSFLSELLVELIGEGMDARLLPEERRMISAASREYSVPIDLPEKAYLSLREKASKAGERANVQASALLMIRALKDPSARGEHASFFAQGPETAKFVEDGDRSHLLRASEASRASAVNYVALGQLFYDLLMDVSEDRDDVERVARLGSEELKAELGGYAEELKNLVREGMKARELERENESLRQDVQILSSKNARLRGELEDREGKLEGLGEQVERLRGEKTRLERELTAERERAEGLQRELEGYEDEVCSLLLARDDPILGRDSGAAVMEAAKTLREGDGPLSEEDVGLARLVATDVRRHFLRFLLRHRADLLSERGGPAKSRPHAIGAGKLTDLALSLDMSLISQCYIGENEAIAGLSLHPGPYFQMLANAFGDESHKVSALGDVLERSVAFDPSSAQ
ncbi:hypothetical protein PQ610_06595 [Tardisphaera miroshnichenkoae]